MSQQAQSKIFPPPRLEADDERDRAIALRELLAPREGEHHVVAIQDFPDPDAISSAMAYRTIARTFGIETEILYNGLISHPENLALVNLLDIQITRYTEALSLEQFDAAVFVDNQGTTTRLTPRLQAAGVPTLAVIDHHDAQEVLDPIYVDVRNVGAAATQMTDYLRSGVFLEMDADDPQHVKLATALMHGLHSETDRFLKAGKAEYAAAAFLSHFIDTGQLERVLCVEKSRGTMDTIQQALEHRTIRGGLAVSGVGYIRWPDRDAIPQAADFLLTEENVNTVVVYGIVCDEDEREVVSGSLRTNNATMTVNSFLGEALGKDARDRPYGGGRSRAGGFEIDLGFLAGDGDPVSRESKWSLFDAQIRRKLFAAAGLETGEADQEIECTDPPEDI
ncbi:MAG TPA: bifunctional oligoribonuclease/PAP phosphatase NrnA [Longimicrobiaceae bacterium]|nr:bifunctional oligoribonuclease/PAP phosphatase NrnA [Longimicrobiaceae bacterium]